MKIALLILAASLTGCAAPVLREPSKVTIKSGQVPQLGASASASVGSPVFTQFHYWSKTGIQIGAPVAARVGLGRVVVQAGDFLTISDVEGETAYCTENLSYADPLTGPFKPACFVDRDKDGSFEIVKAAPGMLWFETKLETPAPYANGEVIRPSADSKKLELLYQGYAGKTIKLSYREYINDMARPAFFQDVSYEVESFPAEITFKSARIRVLSAGNAGISYIVLTQF